jgi:hypothetical protein
MAPRRPERKGAGNVTARNPSSAPVVHLVRMSRTCHAAIAALLLASPLAAQEPPSLSGSWILKDTPAADTATGADSAPPGPPSDLRPLVRPGRRPEDQAQLRRLVAMAAPVAAFTIAHGDSAVTFTNADGFTYTVHPARGRDSLVVGEETIDVRSRWRRGSLEVEFRPPGGGRILETYTLADSRIFLRLEVVVEHDVLAQRLWRSRMYRLKTES